MSSTTIFTVNDTKIVFNNLQIESIVKTDSTMIIRFNTGTIFNINTYLSDESNNYFRISKEIFDNL